MKSDFIKIYKEKPWYKDKDHLPTALIFLFLVSILSYTLYVDGNSVDLKYETSFKGEIVNTFNQKSTLYLKLSTEDKWIKLENFRNESYAELGFNFMRTIKKGDSLYKTKNSNTIYLIRLNKEYAFQLENL